MLYIKPKCTTHQQKKKIKKISLNFIYETEYNVAM